MCRYCQQEKPLLKGIVDQFQQASIFGLEKNDMLPVKNIWIEEEVAQVFIDRGFMRLTIGDDIGCLDHSVDLMKVNFCPNCGDKIN